MGNKEIRKNLFFIFRETKYVKTETNCDKIKIIEKICR